MFFFKGFIIGIAIAAPVGPIGLLCIQRTLNNGRLNGFVSGLGAATADAFYGSIAGFGLTAISDFFVSQQFWFRLVGGAFILFLGARIFFSKPAEQAAADNRFGLLGSYGTTFLLTLTNPLTILSFAAVFSGLGIVSASSDYGSAGLLILGVFLGSTAWWLILSGIAGIFRQRFKPAAMQWVNRLSGAIILGFGVLALGSVFL